MVFRSAVPSPPLKCLYNLTCILPDAEGAAGSQACRSVNNGDLVPVQPEDIVILPILAERGLGGRALGGGREHYRSVRLVLVNVQFRRWRRARLPTSPRKP